MTLRYVYGAIAALAGVILLVPPIRDLLKFGPLHGPDLVVVAGLGGLLLILLEGLKAFARPGAGHRPAGVRVAGGQ